MKKLIINSKTLFNTSLAMLLFAFVIFYFSDGISKILFRSGSGFYRFGPIVKGLFEIIILIYSIITINRAKANILATLGILTGVFLTGQFFLSLNFQEINFAENFNTLFKYLFPFIFFLLAVDILKFQKQSNKLLLIYKWIIGLNATLIIYGFITNNKFLSTYNNIYRFGYDGLIFAQNEASFIFIFALTIVYYRRFYLGIKEYFFWIVLIPSFFVATKAVYLYIVLLLIFHIFQKVALKNILIFAGAVIVSGYLIFSKLINEIVENSWAVFMYMYNKGGLWNALLSGRNMFINEKLIPLITETWLLPNFVFGGQDVTAHYIEMGFIDLFLFFGMLGSIVYLFVFYKIFNIIAYSLRFKIFFGLSLFIIITTAGHFFESGIVGIHFVFLLLISRIKPQKFNKETTRVEGPQNDK
jgi:hypothetical protein